MKTIILFLKEIQPRDRFTYFWQNFLITFFVVLLGKIIGYFPVVKWFIYVGSVPFYFIVAYGRILDIENGMRRKTLLGGIWCLGMVIVVLFKHYTISHPVIKLSAGEAWLVLPVLIAMGVFNLYMQFKRGEKAITKEKKDQARIAEEATWDDNLKQ